MMPEMVFRIVVLPAPLAPSTVAISPCAHLQADAADRLDRAVGALDVAPARRIGSSLPTSCSCRLPAAGSTRRRPSRGRPRSRPDAPAPRPACPARAPRPGSSPARGRTPCDTSVMSCSTISTVMPRSSLDVLDPERHVVGFLDVQARRRLVEQQQLGLGAQRARQLHHLAHAVGQAGDHASRGSAAGRGSRSPARPSARAASSARARRAA